MIDLGHWECSFDVPELSYGFVYEIENLVSGKKYIGKKQMQTARKMPPLKGKKRRRIKVVETDWRIYTGSSNDLNEDIKQLGKEQFKFTILSLCDSKWELSYKESKIQFEKDVLLSEKYYNGIINLRIGKAPKRFTEKELI